MTSSGHQGRLPRKSRTVDGIIFEIEDDFRTPFESAVGRSACGWAYVQWYSYTIYKSKAN